MDTETPSTAYPASDPLQTLFRPGQTFDCWCGDYMAHFTCFAFSPCESNIIIGSSDGKIEVRNIQTGEDVVTYERDRRDRYAELLNMEPNRTGELLLTSDSHQPSSLWSLENLQCKHQFEQMDHVEFSKNTQDKIVGNKRKCAFIYDVSTGLELMRLNPKTSKHHSRNQATFHPSDDVILFGDSLWDARRSTDKPIHKFYHLNDTIGGTFHPNGHEIVACSGVWDTRTYGLLRTLPDLEDCKVTFSNSGQIIYALRLSYSGPPDLYKFDFKTLDARDYSPIGTFVSDDFRRDMQGIYGLCCNSSDTQIAVGWGSDSGTPCQATVQLYDVGLSNDDVGDEESDSSDGDDLDGDTDGEESDVNSDEDVDRRSGYPLVAQKRPLSLEDSTEGSLQADESKRQHTDESDGESSSSSEDELGNGRTVRSSTTTSGSDDEAEPLTPQLMAGWNSLRERELAMYPYLVNGIDSTATLNQLRNDMEARAAETIAGIEARIAEELKQSKR